MIEQSRVNKRFLLIPAAISFAAGIALSSEINPPHLFLWLIIALCPLLIFLSRASKLTIIGLIIFFMSVGLLHSTGPVDKTGHLTNFLTKDGEEITISGTLAATPTRSQQITRILVEADTLFEAESFTIDHNKSIMGQGQPIRGKLLISTAMIIPDDISPGDGLLIKCRIKRPGRYGNPGSFDYPEFLAAKGIFRTGWINSPLHLRKLNQHTKPNLALPIFYFPEKLRHEINNYLSRQLPPVSGGIYRAILTGDRSGLDPNIAEEFKKSGTFHLLAISGLHMGLLAAGCALVLNWLICRFPAIILRYPAWKPAAALTIPIIMTYAMVAGFQPPAIRAMIMTTVFLISLLIDRQWHPPTNIAIAAILILWWQPQALFSVSFQLSFAAIIAITAVLPHIIKLTRKTDNKTLSKKISQWLIAGIIVSLAATAGTAPLLVYYFHRISLIGTIATLVLQPLLCLWALPVGLISVPLIFLWPSLGQFVLTLGAGAIDLAIYLNSLLSSLPWSEIRLTTPTRAEICCYYIALITLFQAGRNRRMLMLAIPCLIVIIATAPGTRFLNHHRGYNTVSVLDVGQGSCALIELEDGTAILIDAGSRAHKFNSGEHIVAPFLWQKRIREINHIIISHADSDHYNGLPFIIENFNPQFLWVNETKGKDSYNDLIRMAREHEVQIKIPRPGEIIYKSGQNQVKNISSLHLSQADINDNDRSLVIKFTDHTSDFLFSGDIEEEGERTLLANGKKLKTDVLIVPHHGSATSSSNDFIEATNPQYALISAGKYQPATFPATEVTDRYQKAGCKILNTATNGAITLNTKNNNLNITTFYPRRDQETIHR